MMVVSSKILILEDERQWQLRLKRILGNEGYDVEVVGNPQKAAARLRKASFDAFVVDVRMREWDDEDKKGLELLSSLPAELLPAVIIVSGVASKEDTRHAFKDLGVVDVFDKLNLVDEKREFLRQVRNAVKETAKRRSTR